MRLVERITALASSIGADIKQVFTSLDTKVDKVSGKVLSANDYTTAEKTKLTNIAAGATKNASDSHLLDRGNHTGTQPASTITGLTKTVVGLANVDNTADSSKTVFGFMFTDTRNVTSLPNAVPARTGRFEIKDAPSAGNPPLSQYWTHLLTVNGWDAGGSGGWPTQISFGDRLSYRKGTSATTWGPWNIIYDSNNLVAATTSAIGLMTSADKTKLDGIATQATKNDSDVNLKNRSNHTGTQAANTITGLSTVATSGSYNDLTNIPQFTKIDGGSASSTYP